MTNRERAIATLRDLKVPASRHFSYLQAIERAIAAAVQDVQAQLDAERKAHAETLKKIDGQAISILNCGGVKRCEQCRAHARTISKMADAVLAAPTRAKGE